MEDFPLFTTINRVVNKQLDPGYIVKYEEGARKVTPAPPQQPAPPAPEGSPKLAPLSTLS